MYSDLTNTNVSDFNRPGISIEIPLKRMNFNAFLSTDNEQFWTVLVIYRSKSSSTSSVSHFMKVQKISPWTPLMRACYQHSTIHAMEDTVRMLWTLFMRFYCSTYYIVSLRATNKMDLLSLLSRPLGKYVRCICSLPFRPRFIASLHY